MRVLFCGGGTAGHVHPAIAIGEKLRTKYAAEIAFIGRVNGAETEIIKKRGHKLYTIKIQGLSRNAGLKNIKSIGIAFSAIKDATKILEEFLPDIIVGTGGYVCWPVFKAADAKKIPTIIHESNAIPGLTTKLLSNKTNLILLNIPECMNYFKNHSKIRVVGNPLLSDFDNISKQKARQKIGVNKNEFFILSYGGSGGAEVINSNCIGLMKSYSLHDKSIKHIHATGRGYYNKARTDEALLCKGIFGCKIVPYIEDMATFLNAADIVISRSGAMTLSEISKCGTASILIPSPNVANNHQLKNAEYFMQSNAAFVLEEKNLSVDNLISLIKPLQANPDKRIEMENNSKKLYKDNPAEAIAQEILEIVQKYNSALL